MGRNPFSNEASSARAGVACGVGAYLLWGLGPVYFKLVKTVPAVVVLGHRIAWSVLLLGAVLAGQGRWAEAAEALRSRKKVAALASASVLIAINWGVFIWAVSAGKVLEASLGYFITPLINVMLGVVVLKERLRPMQVVGIALASIGVVVLTARLGHIPWVAVALAISFSGYGLLRKVTPVGPVVGLTIETAILLPMAIVIIAHDHLAGDVVTTHARTYGLLMLSSVVTAVPLLCFAAAAKRLKLGTLGFLQYISPTCQFLLAVVAFHETFTRTHLIGFSCIWVALGLYSIDSIPRRSAVHPLPAALLELDA